MEPWRLGASARSCHFTAQEWQQCVRESEVSFPIETLLEDHSDSTAAPVAQPGRCQAIAESVALVRASLSSAHVEAKVAGSKPARGSTIPGSVECAGTARRRSTLACRQRSILARTCGSRYPFLKLTSRGRASGLRLGCFQRAGPVCPVQGFFIAEFQCLCC